MCLREGRLPNSRKSSTERGRYLRDEGHYHMTNKSTTSQERKVVLSVRKSGISGYVLVISS
jgi:hypothetical protein